MNKSLTKESLLKQLELDGKEATLCTQAVKELLKYKEIEEELGIDLVTLLRVQTVGAYFIDVDKKWIPMTDYNEKCFKLMESKIYRFFFKDYGKTWALTKEELE